MLAYEYILTLFQIFENMARPNIVGINMSPLHVRAKKIRKNTRKTKPPKTDSEGK